MKEIRILIRQLKAFPDNWFVHPKEEELDTGKPSGLVITDKDGIQHGFIRTGTNDGQVIIE